MQAFVSFDANTLKVSIDYDRLVNSIKTSGGLNGASIHDLFPTN